MDYSLTIRPLSGTRKMRCAQGHEWTAEPWEISTVVGSPECHSGPLCPYCYVEWHRRQFPAETDWEIGGDAEFKHDWPLVNLTAPCAEYVNLTPTEQSLIQQAQEAARSGYPGCYRTPNMAPADVKPKAGYYWYKEGRTWRVVEVTEDGHFAFVVWLQDRGVEVVYREVDLASGEWGARIVHE